MENFTIFLDFDGVLTFQSHLTKQIRLFPEKIKISSEHSFNENCAITLIQIIDYVYHQKNKKTDIVISSTWRNCLTLEEIKKRLKEALIFVDKVDKTESFGDRGAEIKEYCEHNNIKKFLVIDDSVSDIKIHIDFLNILYIQNGWIKSGLNKKYLKQAFEKIDLILKEDIYPFRY